MNSIRKLTAFFVRCVVTIVISALTGMLMLVIVYQIPEEAMAENMARSAAVLIREGEYPRIPSCLGTTSLDNFTDTLMLQNAALNRGGALNKQFL